MRGGGKAAGPGGAHGSGMFPTPVLLTWLWLPDYKPVSVPLRAAVIHLGRPLLGGSSNLPGSSSERAAPPPLFGLAPRGVYPAGGITPAAVRSYRTISPLPDTWRRRRYIFCGTFRIRFRTPAVSRHAALWRPDFPPPFPGATTRPAASTQPLSHRRAAMCTDKYRIWLVNP